MDSSHQRRRLKRNASPILPPSSENPPARVSFKDLIVQNSKEVLENIEALPQRSEPAFANSFSNIYTEEEEDSNAFTTIGIPSKHKQKKRNPLMSKPNKLFDLPIYTTEEANEHPLLNIQDLVLPDQPRPTKKLETLLEKCKKDEKNEFSVALATSLIKNSTETESLIITELVQVKGFIYKRTTVNPRGQLKEQLKVAINNRKTHHLDLSLVFSKSTSDLVQPSKEESDSDFLPEDEREQALQLDQIINLEEGNPLDCQSEESIEQEETNSAGQELIEQEETNSAGQELIEQETPVEQGKAVLLRDFSEISTIAENSPVFEPKRTRRSRFIDDTAELGSDHEDHDYVVKQTSDSDAEETGTVEGLIDDSKLTENQSGVSRKFIGDMIVQDHSDLNKVINADFKRRRNEYDFLNDTPGMMPKKMKLLGDKRELIQNREHAAKTFTENSRREPGFSDEEEGGRFNLIKQSFQLRAFRNQPTANLIVDDSSISYLKMIEKPKFVVGNRTLINDSERSNSLTTVFKESTITLNKNFSFTNTEKKEISQKNPQRRFYGIFNN